MRGNGWTVGCVVGGMALAMFSGCVSLDDHRRLQAQNRSLVAAKESLAKELLDARMANDTLRTRSGSLERELNTSKELATNLRKENDLLEDVRRTAQSALEEMAAKQKLDNIAITGPKLPEALDAALKRFAQAHSQSVVYDAAKGTVKWKADLLFDLGSDVVKESSLASLRSFTKILQSPAAKDFDVIVVGHTDNRPIVRSATKAKHPTNWHLSAHRAISVALIMKKYGYAPERIGVMGRGEYRPVADNSTPAGSSQNRRVEIYIVPKDAPTDTSARVDSQPAGKPVASPNAPHE